eukprot:m.42187 g.42187  ORF g.42187 m.42187 type:complete len:483 (+) comp9855_c0_seq2:1838-3286(+)
MNFSRFLLFCAVLSGLTVTDQMPDLVGEANLTIVVVDSNEAAPNDPDTVVVAAKFIEWLVIKSLLLLGTIATAMLGVLALFSLRYSQEVSQVLSTTLEFWGALLYYWKGNSTYADCPYFENDLHARVHVRSLALVSELWSKPHYRNGTFAEDMRKNLRNVALPGTGIPLSLLCWSSLFFKLELFFGLPFVSLVVARSKSKAGNSTFVATYKEVLLTPTDWFSLWRLNCRLASYHALRTEDAGFRSEDKWTFLTEGSAKGIPVSPFLKTPKIVVKDRNEEGGLGIHFYKNAMHGGDWIIQVALENNDFVSSLLPKEAPLSTIRIVTASEKSFNPDSPIKPLSCVFRAGRAGAATDHDAILFDVNLSTGEIGRGTVNKKWYRVGLSHVGKSVPEDEVFTAHPDSGVAVSGRKIPNIEKIVSLCLDAHSLSCPNVPLCGWDVAMTQLHGNVLLEVNLSCNFFQGTVDIPSYIRFVDTQFKNLEKL